MKLSVVISTYNRAKSLERTLQSVSSFADEIVVVDNESPDETAKVAKKYKAIIVRLPNNPMLNVNKNAGIRKASGEWILYIDDDEVIPKELAEEITRVIRAPVEAGELAVVGYWIKRKNIIFGKWIEHGIWWPDQQLRLFKKSHGIYPAKHVHEHLDVSGPTGTLVLPYIHYNYDSIAQYLWKMEMIYTDSEVTKLVNSGYHVHWRDAIRFPVSDFVKLYFAQQGYKDGLHGLVLAMLQAFYSFIVFAKLWEREQFELIEVPHIALEKEFHRSKKEIGYWMISEKIRRTHDPVAKIFLKLYRKWYRV